MSKLLNSEKASAKARAPKALKGDPESIIGTTSPSRATSSESIVPFASVPTRSLPLSVLETATRAVVVLPRVRKRTRSNRSVSAKTSLDVEEIAKLNEAELRALAKTGINSTAFFRLIKNEPVFTLSEWAYFIGSTVRTLEKRHRLRKPFGFRESERVIEVLLLNREGLDLFHTVENFREWTHADNFALGGPPPVDFLDSSFGIRLVNNLIGRIKYGVFS